MNLLVRLIQSSMSKIREIKSIGKNLIYYPQRFYLNYRDVHGSLSLSNFLSGLKVFIYLGGNPISVLNSVLKIKKSFGEDLLINHASYINDFMALNVSVDLIFDHNGGGGTNLYTKQLIKTSQVNSKSVMRIWFFERCWFLQIISKHGGNVLLYETSLEKLMLLLSRLNINSIIINSLYGSPKIDEIASEILKLSEINNTPISFKVHDFFSACPSPHLVNDKGIYCGIPSDKNICNDCLKNIPNWYHPWIENKSKANDIDQWRSAFNNIFSRANEVIFFNESAVEIFSRAFLIDKKKIHIKPHKDDYFKSRPIKIRGKLNIGIIGSLNPIKGIKIVKQLGDFIKNEGVDAAITVIGEVSEEMSSDIKIHGKYSVNDLPDLIETYGVNLIFFPSIVPETFSYTISEAMKMKLPIVAFNLGAQGQRVSKYNLGKVIPMGSSSEVIFKTIYSLRELRKQDL
jgi:glycosyltransferase involved in cell wall biosynthesis